MRKCSCRAGQTVHRGGGGGCELGSLILVRGLTVTIGIYIVTEPVDEISRPWRLVYELENIASDV
jgi:hypothetical protein